MARIRSVHPELCEDEMLANVSPSAERTFVRLWTELDDDGRAKDNPKLLKAALYPLHDDMTAECVDRDLEELAAHRIIIRYEIDGQRCLSAKPDKWKQYQKPRHVTPSKLPPPPEDPPTPDASMSADCGGSPTDVGHATALVVVGGGVGEGVVLAAAAAPAKRRDELWDAVLEACQVNPNELTGPARGAANKAVAELRGVNATPREVRLRALAWPNRYPNATLTPAALAKHWPQLDPTRAPPPNGKAGRNAAVLERFRGVP